MMLPWSHSDDWWHSTRVLGLERLSALARAPWSLLEKDPRAPWDVIFLKCFGMYLDKWRDPALGLKV